MENSDKKFRLAVIGGGFGRYGLLPSFLLNKRFDVVAVATNHAETANKFATQYNIPKAFTSWERVLEEEIHVLAIATPPAVQGEITYAALQKKIPVFLEKQVALSVSHSKQLLNLVITNQVPNCVNFIFPYLYTWQKARTYLTNGSLGQIRQVFLNWRMESYDNAKRTQAIWKTDDQKGGGVLQHFLSHSFHYLEDLFGKIVELRCTLSHSRDLNTTGSTFASLDLVVENNFIIHVAASNSAYAGVGHSLEIYGTEGSLLLKNESVDPVLGFKLYYAKRGSPYEEIAAEAEKYRENTHDSRVLPTHHLVNEFVNSLDGKASMHPTLLDGHRVQLLLDYAKIASTECNFIKIN